MRWPWYVQMTILARSLANLRLQRPSEVRQQLERSQMPVEEAPNDEDVRQSYNFAPGYHGLVYLAEGRDRDTQKERADKNSEPDEKRGVEDTRYKLQSMQWGKCCKLRLQTRR